MRPISKWHRDENILVLYKLQKGLAVRIAIPILYAQTQIVIIQPAVCYISPDTLELKAIELLRLSSNSYPDHAENSNH